MMTQDERSLLILVANYIARTEAGLAADDNKVSRTATKIFDLLKRIEQQPIDR